MKEKKVLWIALIVLIILNLSQIGYAWYQNHNRPKPRSPKEIIIAKLHFDENQIAAYQKLIDQHQLDLQLLEGHRKKLKEELYEKLSHSNPDASHKINTLSKLQSTMEQLHFQHFLSIKALCRPEQIPAFDSLSYDLAKLFAPPAPPQAPRPPHAPSPPKAPRP